MTFCPFFWTCNRNICIRKQRVCCVFSFTCLRSFLHIITGVIIIIIDKIHMNVFQVRSRSGSVTFPPSLLKTWCGVSSSACSFTDCWLLCKNFCFLQRQKLSEEEKLTESWIWRKNMKAVGLNHISVFVFSLSALLLLLPVSGCNNWPGGYCNHITFPSNTDALCTTVRSLLSVLQILTCWKRAGRHKTQPSYDATTRNTEWKTV